MSDASGRSSRVGMGLYRQQEGIRRGNMYCVTAIPLPDACVMRGPDTGNWHWSVFVVFASLSLGKWRLDTEQRLVTALVSVEGKVCRTGSMIKHNLRQKVMENHCG